MDLSELRNSLHADEEVGARRLGPALEAGAPGGVADEIFARHRHSQQLESQHLCAILEAVLEVLRAQGSQPTPTALFAALMSTLDKPETLASAEVAAAVCTLLATVLPRVPAVVVRSKLVPAALKFTAVVEVARDQAAVAKPALSCLGLVLSRLTAQDWPAVTRPFNLLLSMVLEHRPKVRKRAQAAAVDVVAALQAAPAELGLVSEAIVQVCERVLPGPEAAAKAAAAASAKKRQAAEEAIAAAVADALHLLGLLKDALPLLSGPCLSRTADLLGKLYPLRQPLLTRHAAEALTGAVASEGSRLTADALDRMLSTLLRQEGDWDRRDVGGMLAITRLLGTGLARLHELSAAKCAARLPTTFNALIPLLAAEQDSLQMAASECLTDLVESCVDEDLAAGAGRAGTAGTSQRLALQGIIGAVEGSLGASYQDTCEQCLPVATMVCVRLGRAGAPLAQGLLERIGDLCSAPDMQGAGDRLALAAQVALGSAMHALGPEAVLAALPLNLEEGLAGGEDRAWLLPLLRSHVRHARLAFWGQHLLPLGRAMGNRAVAASKLGRQAEAQICTALEQQLWATLPAFCTWPEDAATSFQAFDKTLAAAFEKRADLRNIISLALRRLCVQTRQALNARGQQVGFPDQFSMATDEEEAEVEGLEDEDGVPSSYSKDMAHEDLRMLQAMAPRWLPLLLNAMLSMDPGERSTVEAAVSACASIAPPAILAQLFRAAMTKLIKAVEQSREDSELPMEDGRTAKEQRCAYLEALLALAGGLDNSGLPTLLKAASQGLQDEDAGVQKKSYKILAYICELRQEYLRAHVQEVLDLLQSSMASTLSAARRYRLRCLKAVILLLLDDAGGLSAAGSKTGSQAATREVMGSLLSEMILGVKEANKKTRAVAYELLVQVARRVHEADPPGVADTAAPDGTLAAHAGGLHALFTMVLGGLVGSTPHMVSAAVLVLARLLYEFAPVLAALVPDLLPTVLLLLRSKAREIIKSVLGFVKVATMRMPLDDLKDALPAILEGILLWAGDSKNKFRLKVRVIIERLARRCGFGEVEPHIPEEHRRLIVHIRKQHNRKSRVRNEHGSQMDWSDGDGEEGGRAPSRTARQTEAKSAWTDRLLSEDGTTADERQSKRSQATHKTQRSSLGAAAGRPTLTTYNADPCDLLDARTTRKFARGAAGQAPEEDMRDDFQRDELGKMIIQEDKLQRKRARDDGFDSDDSDFEDLKGLSGLSLALKGAKSTVSSPWLDAGRSIAGKSQAGRSRAAKSDLGARSRTPPKKGSQHSGERFRAKSSGGDVKGQSKVEPYAYWPLDRNMLNRRNQKSKTAKKGLQKVIAAAKQGAAQGRKAKRARKS